MHHLAALAQGVMPFACCVRHCFRIDIDIALRDLIPRIGAGITNELFP